MDSHIDSMTAKAATPIGETREVTSFCRICGGGCGTRLTIDADDHIIDIRGDKEQPMSAGYACYKGLCAEEAHHGPQRLLNPLKRQPDGSFAQIPLEQALDEIADKLRDLIATHGVDSIALFNGNGSTPNSAAHGMHYSFMKSIGSKNHFTTLSIDQSAKLVSFERLGGWPAGVQDLDQSEVILLFGSNPLLSHSALGCLVADPTRRLKAALARGVKMIAVDPRVTETARHAHLMLQPIPGQDAAIAGGLIRLILDEGWHDAEFAERFVGLDALRKLRAAVDPLGEAHVERRAGLAPGQLRAAAEMFARDNKRGAAFTATGPCMAPFSNLAQHMVDVLNIVCGRMRRAGDKVVLDMLSPDYPIHAEPIPPPRSWVGTQPSRIRGVGTMARERMTGTMAEEMLTPGPGQVRCLLVDGASPASSVPDQRRMVDGLASLDLLVTIDPYMTTTARLSHYILPPKMQYERADLPLSIPGYPLFPENWTQYTPPLLKTPAGSEVIDDWYFFWAIAKRLGVQIHYDGKADLDMVNTPVTDDLLAIRLTGSRVSLDDLKKYPSGKIFDVASCFVQPAHPDSTARFDVIPDDVADELVQFIAQAPEPGHITSNGRSFTHLLSSRRMRDAFNSNGPQLVSIRKRTPYNPAYMAKTDMDALGFSQGDRITIESDHGQVQAIVEADTALRPGVVSISHCWGGLPDDGTEEREGMVNVNLLIACDRDVESINAMPRMSAIPVNVRRVG